MSLTVYQHMEKSMLVMKKIALDCIVFEKNAGLFFIFCLKKSSSMLAVENLKNSINKHQLRMLLKEEYKQIFTIISFLLKNSGGKIYPKHLFMCFSRICF